VTPLTQQHAYRLLNHGPTVLVGAAHGERVNVMAAAWAMPLDLDTPKVAVVIDKTTFTRELIEASGVFSLQVPPVAMADAVMALGSLSGRTHPDKLVRCGVSVSMTPVPLASEAAGASRSVPLVDGCIGWLACRVLPATQQVAGPHDLFLGEVTAAWADARVFANGRWHFEQAPDALRSLHYIAGGQFYAIGEGVRGQAPET